MPLNPHWHSSIDTHGRDQKDLHQFPISAAAHRGAPGRTPLRGDDERHVLRQVLAIAKTLCSISCCLLWPLEMLVYDQ